ncbi:MAG: DUF2058 domain-containing protein [Gammaproteobacteria bacterium]|nr:DUF2058 domain-containing protein [Gammaproteobacteria bacterium]
MSNSLKDQLLKAGLVKKQDVKKQPKKKAPQVAKKNRKKPSENTLRTQRQMLDKAKKDKKLNEQKRIEAEKKALFAQIKQLVNGSKVNRKDGEKSYNFTFGKKVKTIYVTDEQHAQLSKDQLVIIHLDNDVFELVPKVVATKITERDATRVVVNEQADSNPKEDDPYADYEIPDDLMW